MSTAAVAQPHHPTTAFAHSQIRPATHKKTMSVTQTYYLAHKARAKLSREAAQPDHDLRLLVGHANLLDSLMIELADAEREQERWFNQTVANNKAAAQQSANRRVQWADRIDEQPEEEYEEDSDSSDSDSDSDFDGDEDVAMPETQDDLEEDYAQLELVRTPSHSSSPPELLVDHDSEESDDENMPPSPADASLPYTEKSAKEQEQDLYTQDDEYYISRRNPAGLVSAISVY